ncbi:MAG: hypothetical protein DRP35_03640 [Candidatus Zixiibacteriota bacterium]|nr:MAG: hypothetical protein DRP35_03640 [candidate division Zixibacteria bacterium]
MSIKIYRKSLCCLICGLIFIIGVNSLIYAEESDPILEFYVKRGNSVFSSRNPLERAINFSFMAKTYYKKINNEGEAKKVDSAFSTHYYSFGQLDSLIWDSLKTSKFVEFEYESPNIFDMNYIYNFYPNDTGAIDLPIGFDVDSTNFEDPIGVVIIDRNLYFIKWLYLHYPNEVSHKRYSRSFRFTNINNYIFPDSIWVVGAKRGIFSAENYRIETGIYNIEIYH